MQEEEEEVRPASPKYDERSFFYTTPAAFKPAALSGRPQTQWATEGSFLGPAPPPVHRPNPPPSSQAAEAQQQQQQQQQVLEHPQAPSRKQSTEGKNCLLRDPGTVPFCGEWLEMIQAVKQSRGTGPAICCKLKLQHCMKAEVEFGALMVPLSVGLQALACR